MENEILKEILNKIRNIEHKVNSIENTQNEALMILEKIKHNKWTSLEGTENINQKLDYFLQEDEDKINKRLDSIERKTLENSQLIENLRKDIDFTYEMATRNQLEVIELKKAK